MSDSKEDYYRVTLPNKIGKQISSFETKRKINRRRATISRAVIVMSGAAAALLIGADFGDTKPHWPENLALALTLTSSATATMETFFDHRTLWIRYTMVANRLKSLQSDYQRASHHDDQPGLEKVHERLNEILDNAGTQWLEVRHGEPRKDQK